MYMTLLVGGASDARGEVEVRAFGSTKKFNVTHGGRQTVASTRVTIPPRATSIPVATRGDGFLIAR
jgi:hypothetical protein